MKKCLIEKALNEQGLYRIPGSIKVINEYKEAFNKGQELDFIKIHDSKQEYIDAPNITGLGEKEML